MTTCWRSIPKDHAGVDGARLTATFRAGVGFTPASGGTSAAAPMGPVGPPPATGCTVEGAGEVLRRLLPVEIRDAALRSGGVATSV
jgi:hypothetical protein